MIAEMKTRNVVALTAELLSLRPELAPALQLAAFAHDGQVRKETRTGVDYTDPYVIHTIRVTLRLLRHIPDAPSGLLVAGLLHDVLEDAPERVYEYTYNSQITNNAAVNSYAVDAAVRDLAGPQGLAAVHAVTNTAAMNYAVKMREVVAVDAWACAVKASDLIDNAGSLGHMEPGARRARLVAKYREPVETISAACREHGHHQLATRLVIVAELLRELS